MNKADVVARVYEFEGLVERRKVVMKRLNEIAEIAKAGGLNIEEATEGKKLLAEYDDLTTKTKKMKVDLVKEMWRGEMGRDMYKPSGQYSHGISRPGKTARKRAKEAAKAEAAKGGK